MPLRGSGFLAAVDAIRARVLAEDRVERAGLATTLGGDLALLDQVIAFLHGRDELLLDVSGPAVLSRRRVTDRLLAAVAAAATPLDFAELSAVLGLPLSVCCEVVGWLEREGRLVLDADGRIHPGRGVTRT